ncbi:IS1595 family transposase [Spartinivicinus poritis]|uniref:IS1595 family transposase n=1 Tax=Spartinivicinus poritis TaxID=2994640 RepID=A0ABT5UHW2_9GAMM|nr:IS1595 family transposase [Spartinivicinus sp. A2-2]MDE1465979.1 IS1595 family transposase [Spartinivicinus sp. A2-2]
MINIKQLVSDEYCYQLIRQRRWPEGVCCPYCQSKGVKSHGYHTTQKARKRYHCQSCKKRFDDLTFTVFAGHHQPLKVWILCLYFMGLNLSNRQIAHELDLNKDEAQHMTSQLRESIFASLPIPQLSGKVEADEVYIVAGHKGQPEAVKKRAKKSA